jgi:integrase
MKAENRPSEKGSPAASWKKRTYPNLFKKEGAWYLDIMIGPKRIRQFAGCTLDQARNALAKIRLERLNDKLGLSKPKELESVLFEAFADEFLELYAKQNKRSWKRDEVSLKNLKRFFKGKTLQEIGPEQVERYKAQRKTEYVSRFKATKKTLICPTTINRELACLKTLFSKAVEWGRIEKDTVRAVKKFKEDNARERILTAEEARRLVKAAADSLRPVLIIALNTGMRKNEILSLKWADVDFLRGYILIEKSKSGKPRKVPMNGAVSSALMGLPHVSDFVFYNSETKAPVKDIKTAFLAACRRAKADPKDENDPGIVGLRLHDLRHTAATWMIQAGVDIVTVSKILGHASIQMTMRYAHPTPENMKRAVERLGEIMDPIRQKSDKVEIPKPVSHSVCYN